MTTRMRLVLFAMLPLALSACSSQETAAPAPSISTIIVEKEVTASPSSDTSAGSADSATSEYASQPAQQPVQATTGPSQETTQPAVASGTSCGLSSTGASTLVVAENYNEISCDQVQSIFAEFNSTFTSGDTSDYIIQGYTCHTRSADGVDFEGRSVTCTQGATRLEAMTNYSLGGIPVANTMDYAAGAGDVLFMNDRTACTISPGDLEQVNCLRSPETVRGLHLAVSMNKNSAPNSSNGAASGPEAYNLELPSGYSISAYGVTCLNNAGTISCANSNHSFSIGPDNFSGQ